MGACSTWNLECGAVDTATAVVSASPNASRYKYLASRAQELWDSFVKGALQASTTNSTSAVRIYLQVEEHYTRSTSSSKPAASMASQQPLRRLGLDESIVGRMASEGLRTVGDLFSKTELQLVQALNVNRCTVVELLTFVAARIAPDTKTAADLLRERRETGGSFFVASGLPTIDNSLQVLLRCFVRIVHLGRGTLTVIQDGNLNF